MREKTTLKTYNPFEMLGTNSKQNSSRVRRARFFEIDVGTKVQMDLAQWTKKVSLLTMHSTINKEQCDKFNTLGHGDDTRPYQSKATIGRQ